MTVTHPIYREATSDDVAAMAQCRAADLLAGPADARMAAYFSGRHHPQRALLPRAGFVAIVNSAVIGYIAGHLTERFDCQGEIQYLYVPRLIAAWVSRGISFYVWRLGSVSSMRCASVSIST